MFIVVLIPFFFVSWRGAFNSQLIYTVFSIIPLIFLILHKIFIEFKISPKLMMLLQSINQLNYLQKDGTFNNCLCIQ